MGRRLSEHGAYLREAIHAILAKAKEPLDAVEIGQDPLLADVGIKSGVVATELGRLIERQVFPLRRIHGAGSQNTKWKYYNPDVVQPLEDRPRTQGRTQPEPPPPPPAAPPIPEFTFNPVPLASELEPTVAVPPGVKAITVRVGGVSIHIELDSAAVAR